MPQPPPPPSVRHTPRLSATTMCRFLFTMICTSLLSTAFVPVSSTSPVLQLLTALDDSVLNSDVARVILEYVNPKLYSLEETAAVMPSLSFTRGFSNNFQQLLIMAVEGRDDDDSDATTSSSSSRLRISVEDSDSSPVLLLPPDSFLTIHITGDNRSYIRGDLHMRLIIHNTNGGENNCRDLGVFQQLSESRFQRYPAASEGEDTATSSVVDEWEIQFSLDGVDHSSTLGTRFVLYVPWKCKATVDVFQLQLVVLESSMKSPRELLLSHRTSVFEDDEMAVGAEVWSEQQTRALFPPLYKEREPRRRWSITYAFPPSESTVDRSDSRWSAAGWPRNVFLTFPLVNDFESPLKIELRAENGQRCTSTKFFYLLGNDNPRRIRRVMETSALHVERFENQFTVTFNPDNTLEEHHGRHGQAIALYVPEHCQLSIESIERGVLMTHTPLPAVTPVFT